MQLIIRLYEYIHEDSNRNISYIKFKFPDGLVGYSDIHYQNQLNGTLNIFGRGIVDNNKTVRIGDINSSHVGLSKGLLDTKRFYFGYNRENKTVYIVSKNSMDTDFIKKPEVLKIILSYVFNKYKLSVTQGEKLKFIERGLRGRPRIPGKVLLRKLDRIDDLKEPDAIKKIKKHKHKRSTK